MPIYVIHVRDNVHFKGKDVVVMASGSQVHFLALRPQLKGSEA